MRCSESICTALHSLNMWYKRVNNLSKVYLILSSWPSQFRQSVILVEIHPLPSCSFWDAPFSLILFSVMFLPRNAILHSDVERTWPPHLVGCPVKLIETNFHFCVGNKIITNVICSKKARVNLSKTTNNLKIAWTRRESEI